MPKRQPYPAARTTTLRLAVVWENWLARWWRIGLEDGYNSQPEKVDTLLTALGRVLADQA